MINRAPIQSVGKCPVSHDIPSFNALIGSIQRFSLDNGPGIRTTVFFKGCAMRCAWCHNPELQTNQPGVAVNMDRCIQCNACVHACLNSSTDHAACLGCSSCAHACPANAVTLVGKTMTPQALAEELLEDLPFFRASGGGVTFSGGEPGLFASYCAEVAAILNAEGVSVMMQTAGLFHWHVFASRLLPLLDHVYFDIKLLNPIDHKRFTGVTNNVILDNFQHLAQIPGILTATMVLVPGVNDDPATVTATQMFARTLGVDRFIVHAVETMGALKRWTPLTTALHHRSAAKKTVSRSEANYP